MFSTISPNTRSDKLPRKTTSFSVNKSTLTFIFDDFHALKYLALGNDFNAFVTWHDFVFLYVLGNPFGIEELRVASKEINGCTNVRTCHVASRGKCNAREVAFEIGVKASARRSMFSIFSAKPANFTCV